MTTYYDDNYGLWHDMDEPENREHYKRTQKESVTKKCKGCGRKVKILPGYAYCNSCATKLEQGWDIENG
jgi:uncharacterized OB-fold protein